MTFKSETQSLLKSFFFLVKTQFRHDIKVVCTGNGNEFTYMHFFSYSHGTIFQHFYTYTPQQNEVVEHKHHHLLNVGHALRFQANLPIEF